jgi:uncharacterized protein YeaO (DUF488 family)
MQESIMPTVQIKRIYEPVFANDGDRFLVDRLWPRGVSKKDASLKAWLKELAPSDDLRKWYGHRPERWGEFKRRYKLELCADKKQEEIKALVERSRLTAVTLLHGSRDRERNNAVVIKEAMEKRASAG